MDKNQWGKLGIETSRLGFGCMRFPMLENGEIDEKPAEALLDKAYQAGINYFDSAYIYHNGKSETFIGKCLNKYPRESYYIATKMPVFMIDSLEKAKEIFNEQLERLNKDYIDFYLLHGLDKDTFRKAVDLDLIKFCEELKREGKIRYFGFSFHDRYDIFEEILNYRKWDFCQIQLNYMDAEEQAGLKGYALAEKLGVPLVIMEPVKGGSLAALPSHISEEFYKVDPKASVSSWAMRWVAAYTNNKVILSGMSTMPQLDDNLQTFTGFKPLDAAELEAIDRVAAKIRLRVKNGCTGCRYCMPCPVGVDIPENFALWNKYGMFQNKPDIFFSWNMMFKDEEKAKNCVKCGKCEEVCPQKLKIRSDLETLQKEFDDIVKEMKK